MLVEAILDNCLNKSKIGSVRLVLGKVDTELDLLVAMQLITGLKKMAEFSIDIESKSFDNELEWFTGSYEALSSDGVTVFLQNNRKKMHKYTLISLSNIRNIDSWVKFLEGKNTYVNEDVDLIYFDQPYEKVDLVQKQKFTRTVVQPTLKANLIQFDVVGRRCFESEADRIYFLVEFANSILSAKSNLISQQLKGYLEFDNYKKIIMSDVPSISNSVLLNEIRRKDIEVLYLPHSYGSAVYQMPVANQVVAWTNVSSVGLLDHNYKMLIYDEVYVHDDQ